MCVSSAATRAPAALGVCFALALAAHAPCACAGASNVRAWYADGQVWVVWQTAPPDSDTYAIYASPTPFTDASAATLVGRLFQEEWLGARLKLNANDPALTYTIPDSAGGTYALAADEGVFVSTVHDSGALYFGVAQWGESDVTGSVTASPASFDYDLADPPECHVQLADTTAAGNPYTLYCMWVDGLDDQDAGRPDFPVMANFAKNGAPHVFIVSEPAGGVGAAPRPAVWFLHGGDGATRQSFPDDREEIDLQITQGFLVAHDDHLVRVFDPSQPLNLTTWFFGWRKNYDPFVVETEPAAGDTVVNYTQRRLL